MLFGVVIIVGMIWGQTTWGYFWVWDARLTMSAVMFFVYLGYLALRRAIPDVETWANRSAVLGVVALAMIPINHFSVVWWNSLHQGTTILSPAAPKIEGQMAVALLTVMLAMQFVLFALVRRRMEIALLEDGAFEVPTPPLQATPCRCPRWEPPREPARLRHRCVGHRVRDNRRLLRVDTTTSQNSAI